MHDLGEGHFYACFVCRLPADSDARDAVKAQRVIYTVAMNGKQKKVHSGGVVFDPACFTEDSRAVEVV